MPRFIHYPCHSCLKRGEQRLGRIVPGRIRLSIVEVRLLLATRIGLRSCVTIILVVHNNLSIWRFRTRRPIIKYEPSPNIRDRLPAFNIKQMYSGGKAGVCNLRGRFVKALGEFEG